MNFGEVRRAQLAKSLSSPPRWCPWDLFRSFKVRSDAKDNVVRKATGSYSTYSIPGKTAALVREFAVEDLPLAELQPRFLPFGRTPEWRMTLYILYCMPGESPKTTMSRAHSPNLPSLHLRHSSFSNPCVVLPTSQLVLQPFRCPHLRHSSFSNPSFASPSQALHLRHMANRPWYYNLWFSDIWDLYHSSAVIYRVTCKFLCQLNTL